MLRIILIPVCLKSGDPDLFGPENGVVEGAGHHGTLEGDVLSRSQRRQVGPVLSPQHHFWAV